MKKNSPSNNIKQEVPTICHHVSDYDVWVEIMLRNISEEFNIPYDQLVLKWYPKREIKSWPQHDD